MIKSKNIALRPIEESDLEFLCDLANDPFISTMVVGWGFPLSKVHQVEWVKNQHKNNRNCRLVVVDLITEEAIGLSGLWDIDWQNRSAMSATKLLPNKVKKGFGTESIMLTMAWAFYSFGLRRLHGAILDFNAASMAAYVKKCGWRIEGCQKEAVFRKGRWCDLYNVAILNTEFDMLENAKEYVEYIYPADVTSVVDFNSIY